MRSLLIINLVLIAAVGMFLFPDEVSALDCGTSKEINKVNLNDGESTPGELFTNEVDARDSCLDDLVSDYMDVARRLAKCEPCEKTGDQCTLDVGDVRDVILMNTSFGCTVSGPKDNRSYTCDCTSSVPKRTVTCLKCP